MHCRCCDGNIVSSLFYAELLDYNVSYFECSKCGYVQTEDPVWLERAYESSINASDTGIIARNLSNAPLVLATLTLMRNRKSQVVDYAGGYGFLVRLLRDIGVDALWADPYSKNLVARGFEYKGGEQATLVMAFEAFEHFLRPVDEMEELLSIAPNILLTTNLIATPAPQPTDWWYYGLDHGQHIGFYRVQTLQHLADKFGLHLLSDGVSTHFFSKEQYPYLVWRNLMRVARHMPNLFALGLSSKIWGDHLQITKSSRP